MSRLPCTDEVKTGSGRGRSNGILGSPWPLGDPYAVVISFLLTSSPILLSWPVNGNGAA